ncbi:hypothetical protein HanXRQr2_Chr13g0616921 [Helianthus annuus]|uniref:Uncharacterized protein n=1 Tax=Helianthus annuus TaxID=4232 RepID=A0A9K3EMU4_HELAN|nr:hypothetical protein HanXRQr2_Chr13g0616921 [Helianthus annuus]
MAAYSRNKHRSQVSPQISQNYSSTHLSNTILPYCYHTILNFFMYASSLVLSLYS